MNLKYKYVIIGSGFAGRTVASYLNNDEYLIIERGEYKSFGDIIKDYDEAKKSGIRDVEAEEIAYSSNKPWNQLPKLSKFSYSRYSMIGGGSSNWWGGKASRISKSIFEMNDIIEWPLNLNDLIPWYEKAERRLNVSGDPLNHLSPAPNAIAGASYWRTAFSPYFSENHIYNVAVKSTDDVRNNQGVCLGRGHCAVCKEDSKARPENIFADMNIMYESYVLSINFLDEKAISVDVYDGKQIITIEFDYIIVAANGVESPRLLSRCELPKNVNRDYIGKYLQDHAHLEIDCWIDKKIAFGNLSGLSHFQIPELSRLFDTKFGLIETSALALTHEPPMDVLYSIADLNILEKHGTAAFTKQISGCFRIHIELEIPPAIELSLDLESEEPKVIDCNYKFLIPEFELIENKMISILQKCGVKVLGTHPHYKHGYGGHHFVGTINWSKGELSLLDNDNKLIGTDNLYVAGASVIPRVGGIAPTLTLVALAERLGEHLSRNT